MSEELHEHPSRRGVLRAVRGFVRPHWLLLSCALVLSCLASLLTIAGPVIVGRVSDALLNRENDWALTLAIVGVACALVQVAAARWGRAWLARAGEYVVRDVRDRVVDQLTSTSLRFIERHRGGELLQRSTAEIAALSGFVRESLPELVVTFSTVIIMIIVLGFESWMLLLVLLLVFAPAAMWMMHRFRTAAGPAFAAEASAEAELSASFAESVRARSLLISAPTEGRALIYSDFEQLNSTAIRAQLRTVVIARWINAMVLVEAATLAALLLAGTALASSGAVSVGVVITFVLAGRTLFSGFSDLSALLGTFEEAATGAARTHNLLSASATADVSSENEAAAATAIADDTRHRAQAVATTDAMRSALVLESVCFGYGADPSQLLSNISMRIEPGARIALVGRTGAGKSTLVKILAGLYRPSTGIVSYANAPLDELAPHERSKIVTLIPQQVQLTTETLAEELRLGDPAASDERLRQAIEEVGLGAWFAALPAGLGTAVTGAQGLSAGERQLIALARVALIDSRVLILDEATSDVDPRTAALVESAVDRLSTARSVVVVAHRSETIDRLDTVYRLDKQGLHREVASRNERA